MSKVNNPTTKYLVMYKRRQELKEELQDIEGEMKDLLPVVQDYLVEQGIDRETVSGHTLALRRTLWVGRAPELDASEFAGRLREVPELAQYARDSCDTQGLSAYIRGIERDLEAGDHIPSPDELRAELAGRYGEDVAKAMKFTEKFEISVTKSRKNAALARARKGDAFGYDELDDEIPY